MTVQESKMQKKKKKFFKFLKLLYKLNRIALEKNITLNSLNKMWNTENLTLPQQED